MNLSKIIIKIEKTRRRLYNAGHNGNTEKTLKISQELDLLINEYLKLKGEAATMLGSCSAINSVSDKENAVSSIYYNQFSSKINELAYKQD